MSAMQRCANLVLVLWAGSLWTICGLVVPGLFWLLKDDHRLAGHLAAFFFYGETFLGLLLGLIYVAVARLDRAGIIAAVIAMLMPLVFFVVLRPMMASARATGDMARFGQLHGVASLLFLLACIGAGVVVWRQLPSPNEKSTG